MQGGSHGMGMGWGRLGTHQPSSHRPRLDLPPFLAEGAALTIHCSSTFCGTSCKMPQNHSWKKGAATCRVGLLLLRVHELLPLVLGTDPLLP